jgi:hypothetical protein
MSFLSGLASLFSFNSSPKTEDPVEYEGYNIIASPIPEGGQYRVAATITKGEGDTLQTHKFIRSDMLGSRDECIEVTIRKAKMTIDQSGYSLFN